MVMFHARQDSLGWKRWYSEEKAENADLPRSARDLNQFQRLFLLRVMRQDRFLEFQTNNGWSRGHWSFFGQVWAVGGWKFQRPRDIIDGILKNWVGIAPLRPPKIWGSQSQLILRVPPPQKTELGHLGISPSPISPSHLMTWVFCWIGLVTSNEGIKRSLWIHSGKLTKLAGKWTQNEDVFPIEHGDILPF